MRHKDELLGIPSSGFEYIKLLPGQKGVQE